MNEPKTEAEVPGESPLPDELDFVTMGMFIIDEIHHPPPLPPQTNIPGGGGLHALYGARLFLTPPHLSRRCAMLIDLGSDFPPAMLHTLHSLKTSSIFRPTPDRLTTRGWNKYGSPQDPEFRAFRYLTPKVRVCVADFFDPEGAAGGVGAGARVALGGRMRVLHMICSADRAAESVRELWERLDTQAPGMGMGKGEGRGKRPLILWEPVPDLCTPEQQASMLDALALVDVLSPNEGELAAFYTHELSGEDETPPSTPQAVAARAERLARKLATSRRMGGERGCGAVIVRCGVLGCFAVWQHPPCTNTPGVIEISSLWMPAYHDQTPEKVVDPTGAGNAFMGGLGAGLVRSFGAGSGENGGLGADKERMVKAIAHAQVAASFAIEQVGMPELSVGEDGVERWNGVLVGERLRGYLSRVGVE